MKNENEKGNFLYKGHVHLNCTSMENLFFADFKNIYVYWEIYSSCTNIEVDIPIIGHFWESLKSTFSTKTGGTN